MGLDYIRGARAEACRVGKGRKAVPTRFQRLTSLSDGD